MLSVWQEEGYLTCKTCLTITKVCFLETRPNLEELEENRSVNAKMQSIGHH